MHAGQHYSEQLDDNIFNDLGLDYPEHHIDGVEYTEFHGEQTALMLEGIEEILLEETPENVLVCGDANFNLAGALAARKLGLNVGHVEAGLRSDDWRMPEEHNRVIIDHISEFLFAPTEQAKRNAAEDNVKGNIYVTGNTVVDAVQRNIDISRKKSTILEDLDAGEFVLFTAHREENVDDRETLVDLIEVIQRLTESYEVEVVYPIHPRTKKRLQQFELEETTNAIDGLHLIEPVGYLDFLQLIDKAEITLSDSGGVQEESCIIGTPCVTLRENTERPETVDVGSNVIAGTDPNEVLSHVEGMWNIPNDWVNPFGDGTAAKQIIDIVLGE
ncbi:non-hydrolyzing UDP-N-acetylglucosamine 2-epimerase [Saliphagus sp. GCM10025308]